MSRLTDLLRQARNADAQLGADLEAEVATLTKRRSFGLVFEQHQPEAVELPRRSVRRGDKVRVLPPRGESANGDQRVWRVLRIERADGSRVAHLEELKAEEPESQVVLADNTVVVAEFRDTIYPGLVETGRVERGGDQAFHTVINGENYHALEMLTYTHPESVDLIYIDPPYNTGNDDWIYNDRHVSQDDDYRHSKWLAFMQRRLEIARDLLKDTGVIIVAIGDAQHHRLRMLMDQVFYESNFISDVVWQGGRKNDSRYVSNGADYMLIYARDESRLTETGVRWRERKRGLDEARAMAQNIWDNGSDPIAAASEWKAWLRNKKKAGALTDSVARFDQLDSKGEPINTYGNITWPGGGGHVFDILHPATGLPVKKSVRGWLFDEVRTQQEIAAGHIWFGKDETVIPRGITRLDSLESEVPLSVFAQDRKAAAVRLRDELGASRFPNPKDHTVLMRWVDLAGPHDALVVDFFGGSGSTMEAVMRLNAEDGGRRRCILVTNNEVGVREDAALRKAGHRKGDPEWEAKGVYEYVTKPRITTVVTGQRSDGSTYDNRVDANVEFFDLTYESPLSVRHNRAFERIAPMLWLRAGSQGRIITGLGKNGWDVAETYGVLENLDRADAFVQAVSVRASVCKAFIVTDDDSAFQMVCRDLPAGVVPVRLYESYLQNFEINTGRNL